MVTANISIITISNGFVVSDATNHPYGDLEWIVSPVFFPTLEELAAGMPAFTKAAIERAQESEAQRHGADGRINPAQAQRGAIDRRQRIG